MRRIIFNALIASLLTLTGCLSSSPLSTTTTSQVMINKTLSAINLVKSYRLSSDFTENGFLDNGGTEWMGTKLVNVSDKEISTNMLITTGPLSTYTEIYCKDGLEYCKTISEESIPQTSGWTQAKLTDDVWNQQAQISFLAELLKTATQSTLLKIEMLNGVNYYTLSITPSPQASVDWVLSQAQPGGPSFFSIEGGFFVRPDTYHEGSVKLWINQSNDLPPEG